MKLFGRFLLLDIFFPSGYSFLTMHIALPHPKRGESIHTKIAEILSTRIVVMALCLITALTLQARLYVADELALKLFRFSKRAFLRS